MTTPLSSPSAPIRKVQRFEDFYRQFQDAPGVYKYQDQINDIFAKGGNTLIILYEDLLAFDPQIADMLRKDPETLLEDAVEAFENLLKFQGGLLTNDYYFVRIATKDEKSPLTVPIRGLRSKHIDRLVWFKGILIRSSAIRPQLIKAKFECMDCGTQFDIIQLTSKIKWPKFCINKRCKASKQSDFRLISKKSEFIDWQSITIQEIPEDLPAGRIPRSVQAILTYDLVDTVKPGDRLKVMGVFKSVIAHSIKSNNSNLFKTFINVNFIDPEDKTDQYIDISKEDIKKIETLAKEPMIQKKIARSIAPTIYGREDLKIACALSLFAGSRKRKPGGGYKRGDIHVLFVGDPGTGKSEILKNAVEISPRGLYTSGKGSTAVGLTAAVIKDSDTGQMNLEAGAIVLANGGIAAIDEFDKMDSADRSALHEGMEQQTVSIAKAGIVATLKSETAIIAAANPHSGRYDPYKTPTQNIRLPPSLVSRFDLIFVVIDKPDRAKDAQMAEFILQNAMKGTITDSEVIDEADDDESFAPIPGDLLKKYIKHAKRNCKPSLTEEAKERIKDFYLELRGEYTSEDAIVSILARNLDALVRLSEAYAKMALRDKVSKEDVEEIIKLFKRYLNDIGYDETTGKIDMDRVFVGESRSKINKLNQLMDRLKEIFEDNEWRALEKKSIIQTLELEENLDKEFIKNALDEAVKEGTLYEPKHNLIKFTRRQE
ncbi:MAG: AAA domain-containing protein [Candidatus Lokiarchaeota archaeon]|nr:AAA domain-containing protein [Candidatus Lokiarchaeota archaeon]MBD3339504.1 AAA domain-containing protein [Candidatus Lokiarchaeota archaeon]